MDLKCGEDGGGVRTPQTPKKSDGQEGGGNSKMKGTGGVSSKDMIFRADKIDLKSLDVQLEKHLSRVWSRNIENPRPVEEWEIDLAKLDLRHVIAQGTYGTVYRATYDNQDVAGIFCLFQHFVNDGDRKKKMMIWNPYTLFCFCYFLSFCNF